MATLILFFDGVGVGVPDPEENPFAAIAARRLGHGPGVSDVFRDHPQTRSLSAHAGCR